MERANFAGKVMPESQPKQKLEVVCWCVFVTEWSRQVLVLILNYSITYIALYVDILT